MGVQQLLDLSRLNAASEPVEGDAGVEARVQPRFRFGFEHDPGLRFSSSSGPLEFARLGIRRVDLDRQRVAGVDELQEQRKPGVVGGRPAEDSLRFLFHELAQGRSRPRTIDHHACLPTSDRTQASPMGCQWEAR